MNYSFSSCVNGASLTSGLVYSEFRKAAAKYPFLLDAQQVVMRDERVNCRVSLSRSGSDSSVLDLLDYLVSHAFESGPVEQVVFTFSRPTSTLFVEFFSVVSSEVSRG